MRRLLAVTLMLSGLVAVPLVQCFAQKPAQHAPQSLATPLDRGTYSSRLFSDSKKVKFLLITSWIPGENHKGMMRYKMGASPDDTEVGDDPEGTERLMKRVHRCIIYLNLFDTDDFLLRKIVVPFGLGVDDQGRVIALNANSSVQLAAQEYREFMGWNIAWDCGTP